MKRIISIIIVLIVLMCLPYWINDFAYNKFKNEVADNVSLVSEVKPLEIISGCGNTSGTGNHTDLWAGVLIETQLSQEELNAAFADAYNIQDTKKSGETTLSMKIFNKTFSAVNKDETKNYFILEFAEGAPCSALDLRGH